ncbi:MAG: hypothetical protein ABL956_15025 [Hyphomonadaceae bacterium]
MPAGGAITASPVFFAELDRRELAHTILLCEASPDFPYIACARERTVVMVQNAGLLNSLGAFATMGLRYGLPFVIIATNRGALTDPNGYDIEKREAFDASMRPLARVFDFDAGNLPDDLIPAAFKWAEAARKPVIIALEKRLGAEAAA